MNRNNEKHLISLVGGLGNQLFQFANALDIYTHSQIGFVLDFRESSASNRDIDLFEYDIQRTYISKEDLVPNKITKKIHNLFLRLENSSSYSLSTFKRIINASIVSRVISVVFMNYEIYSKSHRFHVKPGSKVIQIGYFQHQNWKNKEKVVKELTSLRLKEGSNHYFKMREILSDSDFLAVHMRFGDYETEPKFGIPNARYFGQAINQILASADHDRIVVFTNDSKKALEKLGSGYSVMVTLISSDDNLTSSETLELMRLAKSYVISNSTFGWWGAFLSHATTPMIICPRPWFIGLSEPKNLIPKSWIEIDGFSNGLLE